MISSPKSAAKSVKGESQLEEDPEMPSKGRHASAGKRKVCLLIYHLSSISIAFGTCRHPSALDPCLKGIFGTFVCPLSL